MTIRNCTPFILTMLLISQPSSSEEERGAPGDCLPSEGKGGGAGEEESLKIVECLSRFRSLDTFEYLVPFLKMEDEEVQERSLEALKDLPYTFEFLEKRAKEGDPLIRAYIIFTVGKLRLGEGLPLCITALQDEEEGVRREAMECLVKLGDMAGYSPLIKCANTDPSSELRDIARESALLLVEGKKEREEEERLLALLNSSDEGERAAASMKLLTLKDVKERGAILHSMNDPCPEVRKNMAILLGRLDERRGIPHLLGMVEKEKGEVAWAALSSLARMQVRAAVRPAIDLISKDGERETIRYSLRALGLLKDRRGAPVIIEFLGSKDDELKTEAIIALGKGGFEEAVPHLARILRKGSETHRRESAGALGGIRTTESIHALKKGLKDRDFTVRYNCIESLTKIGGGLSFNILSEHLKKEKDGYLKKMIQSALKEMEGSGD